MRLQIADFANIFGTRKIKDITGALKAICDALANKTSLVELNLSDNAFGSRLAPEMIKFLDENRTFQVLKLNNNGLGPDGGDIVAKALSGSIRAVEKGADEDLDEGKYRYEDKPLNEIKPFNSNLRVIECSRNRLESDGIGCAEEWARAFAKHGKLKKVRMPNDSIGAEGIKTLVKDGLSKCPELEILDFDDNTAGEIGASAVADALPSWPLLRSLDLSSNDLGPEGGEVLIAALSEGTNKNLKVLRLNHDSFDAPTIDLLPEAIAHLPKLRTLRIHGNEPSADDDCITNLRTLTKRGSTDALGLYKGEEEIDIEDEEEENKEEQDEDVADAPAPAKAADPTDALAELLGKTSLTS